MVGKYTPGQSIELLPFPAYWRGAPKLDKIIRREFQDLAAGLIAFDAGELDFIYITADEVDREKANANATVFPGGSGVDNVVEYNPIKHPEFNNVKFRQALLMAIDRKSISDTLYGGGAVSVPCLYSLPNLIQGVTDYAYDPAGAKALLTASGVDVNKLGTIDMSTYYRDQLSGNVMAAILKNWADNLGIKTGKVQQLDDAAYADSANNGKYDVQFVGAANGPTGNRAFNYFHSSTAYPAGSNGFKGYFYKNPALDKLLEQGVGEFDQAKQDAIYQQACQIMHDDLPWLYLWQTTRYHVVSNKVHNIILIPAAGGGSYYDAVETWTVDK